MPVAAHTTVADETSVSEARALRHHGLVERTIVDVLREVLGADLRAGRLEELTVDEIAELAYAVQTYYQTWRAPESPRLRVDLGAWVGGHFAAAQPREILATMLLYADQVVLHDPLADWFCADRSRIQPLDVVRYRNGAAVASSEGHILINDGWVAHQTDRERNLAVLRWAVPALQSVEPLVTAGAAILVPQLQIVIRAQDGILSAVRHDLRNDAFLEAVQAPVDVQPVTRNSTRGMQQSLSGAGGLASDKDRRLEIGGNPSYYLNKTLAVAAAAGAAYVPPSATDWRLFELRCQAATNELRRITGTDLKVLAALHASELPLLDGLTLDAVSTLRIKEGAMEDWRIALRQAARGLSTVPADGADFAADSAQVLQDALGPVERRVRDEAKSIRRLFGTGREFSVDFVSGVAAAGATGAALGGTTTAVAAAGLSAIAKWTIGALIPPRQDGVASVVAYLRQRNS